PTWHPQKPPAEQSQHKVTAPSRQLLPFHAKLAAEARPPRSRPPTCGNQLCADANGRWRKRIRRFAATVARCTIRDAKGGHMQMRCTIFAACLAAVTLPPAALLACGYDNPQSIALGSLNWVY